MNDLDLTFSTTFDVLVEHSDEEEDDNEEEEEEVEEEGEEDEEVVGEEFGAEQRQGLGPGPGLGQGVGRGRDDLLGTRSNRSLPSVGGSGGADSGFSGGSSSRSGGGGGGSSRSGGGTPTRQVMAMTRMVRLPNDATASWSSISTAHHSNHSHSSNSNNSSHSHSHNSSNSHNNSTNHAPSGVDCDDAVVVYKEEGTQQVCKELILGGKDVHVTEENKDRYVALMQVK